MKRRVIPYSGAELTFIAARATSPRRDAHDAFCKQFGRRDVSLAAFNSLCKRKGWMTGRTGCFTADTVPHNKGKKMPSHPNSKRTQFQKGGLPHNTKHLGHERISKDGYVEISVNQENPHTGYERRYVLKHRHLWEQANGRLPEGHFLKCMDSDRTNTDPSNWTLCANSMKPRLTGGRWSKGYDASEPEVRPTILAVAQLEEQVRQVKKGTSMSRETLKPLTPVMVG